MFVDLPTGSNTVSHDDASMPIVLAGSEIAADQGTHPVKRRGRGVVHTLKRFAYRAAQQLCKLEIVDIMVLDFAPICGRPLEPSPFEFRCLFADEIRVAADDPANDLNAAMAGRLKSKRGFCFAALDRGRLANYGWYALRHVEPIHSFGLGLTIPEDAVYMYKAFTLPIYRGRRLHQATIRRAARFFAPMGIRRMILMVEYGNWASQRSHYCMGCRREGRLFRIGSRLICRRCNAELGILTETRLVQ